MFFECWPSIISKALLGVIGDGVDWEREDCESRRTSCGVGGDRVCRGEAELVVDGEELQASREAEVEVERVNIEMREGLLENFGCERLDLVVVEVMIVVMEEEEEPEPLRSDTRLPLESSPNMAGINFSHGKLAVDTLSTQSPAMYL